MSKKCLALLCIIFHSYIFASPTEPIFTGSYGGVGLGGIIDQFKTNTATTLPYPSSAFFANSQNSANNFSKDVLATLFTGYLYPIKKIYIGPEVYLNFGKPTFSTTQTASAYLPTESLTTVTNGTMRTTEIGVDLRLGLNATPTTLIYYVTGAAFNKLSFNSSSTIARPAIPLSTATNSALNNTVVGLRIGGGLEQKISPRINLRASYMYTSYPLRTSNAATAADASAPFFQLGPITNSTSIKVSTHAILASLVYQFNDNFLGK